MLTFAVVALALALVAGALGYSGVLQSAANAARIVFGLFLLVATVLFVLLLSGVDMNRPVASAGSALPAPDLR
jgi:uncharacterized membrane protein YtjA (UPF0391 family)